MKNLPNAIIATLVVLILLIGVNIISNELFKTARVDLTQQNLHTLTTGTKNILTALSESLGDKETISVDYYFSRTLIDEIDNEGLRSYGNRIRDLLLNYRRLSNGRINLRIIDPQPFSEDEDKATIDGLQPVPVSHQKNLFMGLVVKNNADVKEVIPFFDVKREEFLEYDITKCVYRVSNPKKIVVGLYSSIEIAGKTPSPMIMGPQQSEKPWSIFTLMQGFYDVKVLSSQDLETIETQKIDVLLLIHPKKLRTEAEYAIEQFIFKGGRAIIFTDPHCIGDPPRPDPAKQDDQFFQFTYRNDSTVDHLFAMLNIKRVSLPNEADDRPMADKPAFIADRQNAYQQNGVDALFAVLLKRLSDENPADRIEGEGESESEKSPIDESSEKKSESSAPKPRQKTISTSEIVVSDIKDIKFLTPGAITHESGASTKFIPLLQTSTESAVIAADKLKFMQNPEQLLEEFKPSGKRFTLAAWIRGHAFSAFPSGKPDAPTDEEKMKNHLTESKEDINVIVVADADILTDQVAGQMINFFGKSFYNPNSENSNLLLNSIDALSGSNDLINVRARGSYQRPFTVVKDMERAAMDEYREKIKKLEDEQKETEQKIKELEKGKDDSQIAVLSNEQRAAIEQYNKKLKDIRSQMREILNRRDSKIKTLGRNLRILLIGVWPGLIGAGAVAFGLIRYFGRQS